MERIFIIVSVFIGMKIAPILMTIMCIIIEFRVFWVLILMTSVVVPKII